MVRRDRRMLGRRRAATFIGLQFWGYIFLLLFSVAVQSAIGGTAKTFIDSESLQRCIANLHTADSNQNDELSSGEYVTFLDLESYGKIKPSDFAGIPLNLVLIYYFIACLCAQDGGGSNCCVGGNAKIDISRNSGRPLYTTTFCSLVELGIYDALNPTPHPVASASSSPTSAPVVSPVATSFPSQTPIFVSPSKKPTRQPERTEAPSASPSSSPTLPPVSTVAPTVSPSLATPPPTVTLTSLPTVSPSSNPSQQPVSLPPTQAPTAVTPAPSEVTPAPTAVTPAPTEATQAPTTIASAPTVPPPPTVAPSQVPPASNAPTFAPTSPPPPTAEPSQETIAPTFTPRPPTIVPTLATTIAPSLATSSPTIAPTVTPVVPPTLPPVPPPTLAPSFSTPRPTNDNNVCVSFQYGLENQAGFHASDIFNMVNNSLRTGLLIATRNITIEILNSTFPRNSSVGAGSQASSSEALFEKFMRLVHPSSSNSLEHQHSRRLHMRKPRTLQEQTKLVQVAIEHAIADIYPDINASYLFQTQIQGMYARRAMLEETPVYSPWCRQPGSRLLYGSRRLVYFSDSFPVNIDAIFDNPLCPKNNTSPILCSVVSTTVCVFLEPGENATVVGSLLLGGFEQAVNGGWLQQAIPPQYQI